MLNAFDFGNAYYTENYASIIDSGIACNDWTMEDLVSETKFCALTTWFFFCKSWYSYQLQYFCKPISKVSLSKSKTLKTQADFPCILHSFLIFQSYFYEQLNIYLRWNVVLAIS